MGLLVGVETRPVGLDLQADQKTENDRQREMHQVDIQITFHLRLLPGR